MCSGINNLRWSSATGRADANINIWGDKKNHRDKQIKNDTDPTNHQVNETTF